MEESTLNARWTFTPGRALTEAIDRSREDVGAGRP